MDIDSRTGLVLEGGGMRAIFTVGVLDCFMDHDIWFPYTIGVSAGARTVFRMPPGSAGVPVSAISTCWKNMIISVSGISSGGGDIST